MVQLNRNNELLWKRSKIYLVRLISIAKSRIITFRTKLIKFSDLILNTYLMDGPLKHNLSKTPARLSDYLQGFLLITKYIWNSFNRKFKIFIWRNLMQLSLTTTRRKYLESLTVRRWFTKKIALMENIGTLNFYWRWLAALMFSITTRNLENSSVILMRFS